MTKRLRRFGPPVLLLAVVVCFFWKLTLTDEYTWLNDPDLSSQALPWFQFQATEWQRGEFPVWDPHHWAGQPLAAQVQPGAVYPLNWLLFALPFDRGHIS